MANIAKFKQIAADVVKMGKEAATEKYGEKEIKAAQDSLRRNAEKIRKRRASEEETSSDDTDQYTRKFVGTDSEGKKYYIEPRRTDVSEKSPLASERSTSENLRSKYAKDIEEEANKQLLHEYSTGDFAKFDSYIVNLKRMLPRY